MASMQASSGILSLDATAVNVVSLHSPLDLLVTRPAFTIRPDATLGEAVETMQVAGVSALLVEELGGVVTERDIARAFGRGVAVEELVERVATPHPLVVPASTSIVDACGIMLNEQVRHLVIEHGDGELAVVSLRDIAAVLLQAAEPHMWLASLRVAFDSPAETWLG